MAATEIVLRFSGPLTLDTAMRELKGHEASLGKSLEASAQRVVADLSAVTDVDTSALAVLVELSRQVSKASVSPLVLRAASGNLFSLAELTSVADLFDWEPKPSQLQ